MSNPTAKKSKEDANREVSDLDISKEAKTMIEKILGDVSKTSATKQIVIGTTSGWLVFLDIKKQPFINYFDDKTTLESVLS